MCLFLNIYLRFFLRHRRRQRLTVPMINVRNCGMLLAKLQHTAIIAVSAIADIFAAVVGARCPRRPQANRTIMLHMRDVKDIG